MKIGVIGAGNWGTALADLLAGKGLDVTLWSYEREVGEGINREHKNPLYLTNIKLEDGLRCTSDLAGAVTGKEIIVFVVPSHVARIVARKIAPHIRKEAIFISCTKGIEIETGRLISDVLVEELTGFPIENFCFLSGPSFASEVARRLPTTVVIAGKDIGVTKRVQDLFRTDYFMTFTSEDVIGVQVGGAVKNVIAIACGISDGLGFGHNTRAAIITRGLYEMIKIGRAMGANPFTFAGLAGIGDLILTCTSELSRNKQVGFQIGTGSSLSRIQKSMKQIAEGVATTKAVYQLTNRLKVTAPICLETYCMLYEGKSPKKAVADLTKMELREELRGII